MRLKKLSIIFLTGYLALPAGAAAQSGATYYVSLSGNDTYSCAQAQNIATPKHTINNAIACLHAGDTLYVRGGTYAEYLFDPAMASGTSWANPVTIQAYPGETVWMKPADTLATQSVIVFASSQQYIQFDGINLDSSLSNVVGPGMGGFTISSSVAGSRNPHHLRFKNATVIGVRVSNRFNGSPPGIVFTAEGPGMIGHNEILNVTIKGSGGTNASYGMYISTSDNLFEGLDISDVGYAGMQIYDFGGFSVANNTVTKCRIHDITQGYDTRRAGIIQAGNNNLIYDNLIWNITAPSFDGLQSGISVHGDGNQIYNNTIYNAGDAIAINATNTQIINNIAYGNRGVDGVHDFGGSNTRETTNLFGVDPKFVNPGAANFQLQSSSPAIKAGTPLSVVTTDIVGVSRPGTANDIGAYQNGGPSTPPPPTGVQIVSP